jgi:uncharacterized protein (DUF58 family)
VGLPWLFDGYGLLMLLAVLVFATLLGGAPHVQLLAGGLLVVGCASRIWATFSLEGLRYERSFEPRRVFTGETVQLQTVARNRKILPLPWIELWERLPASFEPDGPIERSPSRPERVWFCQAASLWPYSRARWQHTVLCHHRGAFKLEPVVARAGDPFGVSEREGGLPGTLELVVYPSVVYVQDLALPFRQSAMEVRSLRSLTLDPTLVAGVREYQPGDPQRLVHWSASAHRGSLQVRIPEPTTSLHVTLVVHAGAFDVPSHRYSETLFEMALSAVASVAMALQRQGRPVGLVAAGESVVTLPAGSSEAQLQGILEALARLQHEGSRELAPAAFSHVPPGGTVILATSDSALSLSSTVAQLAERGRQVVVLLAGQRRPYDHLGGQVINLYDGCDLAAVLEGRG